MTNADHPVVKATSKVQSAALPDAAAAKVSPNFQAVINAEVSYQEPLPILKIVPAYNPEPILNNTPPASVPKLAEQEPATVAKAPATSSLRQEDIFEALVPTATKTQKNVSGLVVMIVTSIISLRSAPEAQFVAIIRRMRDGLNGWLEQHESQSVSANAYGVFESATPDDIEFNRASAFELAMQVPEIASATKKLLAVGKLDYQTARGAAALNVKEWLYKTFVQENKLTVAELSVIPVATFRLISDGLYQAIHNSKNQAVYKAKKKMAFESAVVDQLH